MPSGLNATATTRSVWPVNGRDWCAGGSIPQPHRPILAHQLWVCTVLWQAWNDVNAAAVYCRISQDRNGTMLGVERQETLCRQLADRKGWPVVEVYVDNDLSAYTGKPRPAYQRLLADLQEGLRDAVVVVDTDRLTRTPAELEAFIDLADRHHVALANAAGQLDLATSDGRFRARIMGVVARMESEKTERLRRQRDQLAARGRPHPGPRAFGYQPGGEQLNPDEAALIRAAAAAVLSGRSIRSVADEWNTAEVKTSKGRRWTVHAVGQLLVSPRIAGLRQHRGEVIGEGNWPAIIDRTTHERLVALAASRRLPGRPATRLLSGIATCARCRTPMRSSTAQGRAIYACRRQPGRDQACGRMSISANRLDAEIAAQVIAVLCGEGLARALQAHQHDDSYRQLAAQLSQDEAKLLELSDDYYSAQLISRAEFIRQRDLLERRIATARSRLAGNNGGRVLAGLPAEEAQLQAWWEHAPGDQRRAVIQAVVERIDIHAMGASKRHQFDPDRATIIWRA